jgi:hypothetical protein
MSVDIKTDCRPGESGSEAHHEGEKKMDSQTNVQTVVDRYITSLRDRRTQHAITEKFARNPTEASRADIEKDVTSWYFGFASGIKLLEQNAIPDSARAVRRQSTAAVRRDLDVPGAPVKG